MPQTAGRSAHGHDQSPSTSPLTMIDDVTTDRSDDETAYSMTLTWTVRAPSVPETPAGTRRAVRENRAA